MPILSNDTSLLSASSSSYVQPRAKSNKFHKIIYYSPCPDAWAYSICQMKLGLPLISFKNNAVLCGSNESSQFWLLVFCCNRIWLLPCMHAHIHKYTYHWIFRMEHWRCVLLIFDNDRWSIRVNKAFTHRVVFHTPTFQNIYTIIFICFLKRELCSLVAKKRDYTE